MVLGNELHLKLFDSFINFNLVMMWFRSSPSRSWSFHPSLFVGLFVSSVTQKTAKPTPTRAGGGGGAWAWEEPLQCWFGPKVKSRWIDHWDYLPLSVIFLLYFIFYIAACLCSWLCWEHVLKTRVLSLVTQTEVINKYQLNWYELSWR